MLVLNIHKDNITPGAEIIMRPHFWGNPFHIGRDGDRKEVLTKYETWLKEQLKDQQFLNKLKDLAAAPALVCCCAPLPCHGHILVKTMTELKLI